MSNHNFEIGDAVVLKAPFNGTYEGTVARIYKRGIRVHFLCGDKVYIPDYMLHVLSHTDPFCNTVTNSTKQVQTNKSKEQQMKEQNVKPKNIRPEDEVTITVSYHDLALVYAVIGRVFGTDSRLYNLAQEMLDPDFSKSRVIGLSRKTLDEIVRYGNYCKEFEALLFPQEPAETEQQKQIRELREQVEAMQEQSKALLQKARDLEESHN